MQLLWYGYFYMLSSVKPKFYFQHVFKFFACGLLKVKYITSIIIDIVSDRVAGHFDTIFGLIDLLLL